MKASGATEGMMLVLWSWARRYMAGMAAAPGGKICEMVGIV